MAKLENTTVKKSKGKKRKHANTETEDEVANKSVIVEANIEEDEPMQTNTEAEQAAIKSKKRKNKEKGDIVEKRSKSQENLENNEHAATEEHEVEDELHEPTLEELKESKKPENNLAIVTVRQKKKQKHQKLLDNQTGQYIEKEKQRISEYLKKWKHARESWKFEKLRQISIQQSMFECDKLDDGVWPLALEYLAGSKGSAKEKIVKLANDVIEEVDKQCEEQETEEERQSIFNSVKYQRARDLLQIFD